MIIDRYLIREVVQPLLVICTALLVIFITYSLSRFLVDADAGLLQVGEVAQLTVLKSLISLDVLLPLSLFLAVMTGLGRLYTDSEIYAMRAGGISEARLLRPLMRLSLVVAVVVALLSGWVRPWAYAQSYKVKAAAEVSAETGRIREARFYTFSESERTVFIENIAENGSDLDGIFIRTRKGNDLQVITASKGVFNYFAKPEFHSLQLIDAQVFKKVRDGTDFSAQFGSFILWIPVQTPQAPGYKVKSAPTSALRRSPAAEERAEFQWRISTPLSALLLALAAIPLSRSRPRQGRYAKMLLALGIYAVYFNLLDVSRSWVEQGSADSIWWVSGLLGLLVAGLYFPVIRRKSRKDHAED
ncbi:MAG: LPS export ABC transporter permease LptF [Gammaproteobacteria bacterium]|nr:MAG: LPS export ABC transporter permease LptF [Gammaproteobacteria bacterium]